MKTSETKRAATFAKLVLLAGFWLPHASFSETIVPHTARYKIKISVASGTMETAVREGALPGEFDVTSVIKPTGFARLLARGEITEQSRFRVSDEGVKPSVYSSSDTLSRDETEMQFVFDRETNAVTGTVNTTAYEYALDDEVHDRVSIQYQLMHNLLTDTPDANYALMDGDELKQLQITKVTPKRIKVPFGSFDAIGIRHQAVNSKRITTLWCAEELGYLPVMIEQHRKGKRGVHAVLTDYKAGMPGERSLSAGN